MRVHAPKGIPSHLIFFTMTFATEPTKVPTSGIASKGLRLPAALPNVLSAVASRIGGLGEHQN
jgi:hypothetical protein